MTIPTDKRYLKIRQLRTRWGNCSHMLIVRKLKNDPTFPKPLIINRMKLWDVAAIEAYEKAAAAAPRPPIQMPVPHRRQLQQAAKAAALPAGTARKQRRAKAKSA